MPVRCVGLVVSLAVIYPNLGQKRNLPKLRQIVQTCHKKTQDVKKTCQRKTCLETCLCLFLVDRFFHFDSILVVDFALPCLVLSSFVSVLSCLVLCLDLFRLVSCLVSCLILCLVFSCVLPCLVSCLILCLVLSCDLSHLVLSCLALSCFVLPCLVLSCLVLSCLVLSGLVLPGLVLSSLVGYPGRALCTQYRSTGHSTQICFCAK
jgi:hypothetical protein